jgi:hypothetical protein
LNPQSRRKSCTASRIDRLFSHAGAAAIARALPGRLAIARMRLRPRRIPKHFLS